MSKLFDQGEICSLTGINELNLKTLITRHMINPVIKGKRGRGSKNFFSYQQVKMIRKYVVISEMRYSILNEMKGSRNGDT